MTVTPSNGSPSASRTVTATVADSQPATRVSSPASTATDDRAASGAGGSTGTTSTVIACCAAPRSTEPSPPAVHCALRVHAPGSLSRYVNVTADCPAGTMTEAPLEKAKIPVDVE